MLGFPGFGFSWTMRFPGCRFSCLLHFPHCANTFAVFTEQPPRQFSQKLEKSFPRPRLGSASPGHSQIPRLGMRVTNCALCDPNQTSRCPPLQINPQIPRNPLFVSLHPWAQTSGGEFFFVWNGSSDLHNLAFLCSHKSEQIPSPSPSLS